VHCRKLVGMGLLLGGLVAAGLWSHSQAAVPAADLGPRVLALMASQAPVADAAAANRSRKLLFVPDGMVERRLKRAQELLAEKQYADAVRHLQVVLDHPEDFFVVSGDSAPRGIKAEAQRLLGSMPEEARRSYELQFGAEARQLLQEATQSGDVEQLAEVVRRYFHTQAGYEATERLGTHHLHRGSPLAAALIFERLRQIPAAASSREPMLSLKTAFCWMQAEMPERAAAVLAELETSETRISLGGRDIPLFSNPREGAAWLAKNFANLPTEVLQTEEHWLLFRGNATRSTPSVGGAPFLKSLWEAPTTSWAVPDDEDPLQDRVENVTLELDRLRDAYRDGGAPLLPAMHPLVVGNVVLVRTFNNLRAYDLTTGDELWRSIEADRALTELLRNSDGRNASRNAREQWLTALLRQRAWEDATFGTLSSDGTYVFCIEELGLEALSGNPFSPNSVSPLAPQKHNRLTAYEIRTGKLKWEVGGPRGDFALDLSGNFFLGPPLPVGGQLYCLAETGNEIRLLVVNPRNGELQWSQTLAQVDLDVLQDPHRRVSGLSPSAADGVLVCPTGTGGIVGVDLTTRQLLWSYAYKEPFSSDPRTLRQRRLGLARLQQNPAAQLPETNRWLDGVPMIHGQRVIITPIDSMELHCLSLVDGSLLWKRPRGQGLYVGGVYDDKVIIVGQRQMEAVRIADGISAWPQATPIPAPSGRGFLTENLYHVPLSTAEVATIELQTGRILTRMPSRNEREPGNFVCSQGIVLAQDSTSVSAFRQLSTLEAEVNLALAKDPDDPQALAMRGEIRLNQGKIDLAYADLRRSLELNGTRETRALLFESLLEGLRTDFATYSRSSEEIERLIDTPEQRGTYLRVLAGGLQKAGNRTREFEVYLRLAGSDVGASGLERVDAVLTVHRDRWLAAQLTRLYGEAGEEDRQWMDKGIQERLSAAIDSKDPAILRTFITHFRAHPLANLARQELVNLLLPRGLELELEGYLRELEQSPDPEIAGPALAQLASLLIEAGRPADAAYAFPLLAEKYAETVCLDGETGKQLAEKWAGDPKIATSLVGAKDWPTETVEVTRKDGTRANNFKFLVQITGNRGPFYADLVVSMDQRQKAVFGLDGAGNEAWRISLEGSGGYFNPYGTQCRVHNHLVMLSLGTHLYAVDTLGTEKDRSARVLWKQDLVDVFPNGMQNPGINLRQVMLPGGGLKFIATDHNGQPLGMLGAVNSDMVVLQRGRQLLALDPISGEVLWQRHDVAPGSEVFGDRELLFVVPQGEANALVLRSLDGHELGKRVLPPESARSATFDRYSLLWQTIDGKQRLSLRDLWDEKSVWEKEFPADSRVAMIEDDEVAVLEPGGRFLLLRVADGSGVIDEQLKLPAKPNQIRVVRSADHYVLFSGQIMPNNFQNQVYAFGYNNPVIDGMAHGFDRATGRKLWSQTIERQGLDMGQARNLPVLIFASRVQQQIPLPNGQISFKWDYQLHCLDKRTGKIVLEDRAPGAMNTLDVTVDAAQKRLSINVPAQNPALYELQFSNDPAPAVPPKEPEETPAEKASGDVKAS